MADAVAQLPDDLQRSLAMAMRAGEIAGLPTGTTRQGALLAVEELLLDRAESLSVAAQYADYQQYRQRDEDQAAALRQLAAEIRALAEAAG